MSTMPKFYAGVRRPGEKPRYSARPFFLTILVILSLAVISQLYRSPVWQADTVGSSSLEKRQAPTWPTSGGLLLKREEEAEDQVCRHAYAHIRYHNR